MPSDAEAWKSPLAMFRSRYGTASPVGKPPRTAPEGTSTALSVIE